MDVPDNDTVHMPTAGKEALVRLDCKRVEETTRES